MIKSIKKLKNKWNKQDRYTRIAVIVIIIATIFRFFLSAISIVSGDACWHVNAIRFISENHKIPTFEPIGRPVFWPPPLFHILGAAVYKSLSIFGNGASEFSVQLLSPIFGSLCLVFVFIISKKLYNTRIAFYSTIFISFLPEHMYHSAIPFIEVFLVFLVLVSVYFMLNERFVLSSVFAGLALVAKYNGVFVIFPLFFILYMKYGQRKEFLKKSSVLLIITTLIGASVFIHHWIYFHNPIYVFFNDFFHGINPPFGDPEGVTAGIFNLFNILHIVPFYLGLFGVPSGNLSAFSFISLPFMKVLLFLWISATIFYIAPLIIGLSTYKIKEKKDLFLFVWFLSFFIFVILEIIAQNLVYTRYMMPGIPVFAIFWGRGLVKVTSMINNKRLILIGKVLLILTIMGFMSVEVVKSQIVKNLWGFYEPDFKWVRENTPKNASIIVLNDNCFTYHFDRYTQWYSWVYKASPKEVGITHIFINQDMKIIGLGSDGNRTIYPSKFLSEIKSYQVVYSNNITNTKIYKVE